MCLPGVLRHCYACWSLLLTVPAFYHIAQIGLLCGSRDYLVKAKLRHWSWGAPWSVHLQFSHPTLTLWGRVGVPNVRIYMYEFELHVITPWHWLNDLCGEKAAGRSSMVVVAINEMPTLAGPLFTCTDNIENLWLCCLHSPALLVLEMMPSLFVLSTMILSLD